MASQAGVGHPRILSDRHALLGTCNGHSTAGHAALARLSGQADDRWRAYLLQTRGIQRSGASRSLRRRTGRLTGVREGTWFHLAPLPDLRCARVGIHRSWYPHLARGLDQWSDSQAWARWSSSNCTSGRMSLWYPDLVEELIDVVVKHPITCRARQTRPVQPTSWTPTRLASKHGAV